MLLPLRILLSGLLARLLQLLLNLSDLRNQPGQLVTQGAALAFQLRQFVAALLQRLARGGDVERLVLTDRRMLVRTTQWAGFARLQLGAVGFQILNALLLLQQLFLVGLLLLERLVTLAQAGDFIVLAGVLLLQLSQTRVQLGDLCSRLLTALRQLLQTIQYAPLHLQLLPTLAQSSLVALAQQGLQLALLSGLAGARILQPLQRVGLLHTELITLLLQGGELFTFLRHACVQCLLLLEQLPALIELHTPTTQKLAQAFPLRRSAHACV